MYIFISRIQSAYLASSPDIANSILAYANTALAETEKAIKNTICFKILAN